MIRSRVLIVDDDARSRFTTAAALQSPTNDLEFAASGAEALQKAREWHPDLVLLDVMMPDIDGFEVCRQLRADPDIADIRVFLLTALDDSKSRLSGFESGADAFITKPLNRDEALARIAALTRLNRIRALIQQRRLLLGLEARMAPESAHLELGVDELAQSLDQALQTLRLAFQPIVRVGVGPADSETLAYEALMRTQESRLPTPPAILAAASMLDREHEVGRVVRRLAAGALGTRGEDFKLFVNLTGTELQDELLYTREDPIMEFADRTVFELTEREPLEKVQNLRHRVQSLRERGFRFAVDDLGSGYASLNSFALIEPEYVKLDRDLVRGVRGEPTRQKIISAMLALCKELDIELIVEGIELEDDRRALLDLGCELQQGFLFGRPSFEPSGR